MSLPAFVLRFAPALPSAPALAPALVFVLASLLSGADAAAQSEPAEGTKRMAARLAEFARNVDPESCPFFNDLRAELMRRRVRRADESPHGLEIRLRFAMELLQAGHPEEALPEVDKVAAALDHLEGDAQKMIERLVDRVRVLCWLRIGEVENCLGHHCCSSCIAPIEAGGVHSAPRGSEAAIPVLMKILARDPGDAEARWLLNLAHMTLGTWPDGVPEKQRIDPSRFASEYPLPRFRDVAPECGLGISTLSGGVCIEDFDHDGFFDVITSSIGLRDPMHYFKGNPDGTFTERTAEAGLTGLVGGLNMIHADYDNDGWSDVFVLRGAWFDKAGEIPNSLLRNRGDGTFEDVTEAAGVLSAHPTQTGSFADFNGDGWLDLVIGNETQDRKRPHPCELYVSNRDGTFRNVAAEVGADLVAFVKAVAVGDFDDDGRPDVFYSRRTTPNMLLRNVPDDTPGGPGFKLVDATQEAGVSAPSMSFPSWFFDYDNDGRLDLFVATNSGFNQRQSDSIGEFLAGVKVKFDLPILYHNDGGGKFTDVGHAVGLDRAILSMGSNYGDFDNDGWLDLYLGNGAPSFSALIPNKAFRNDGGQRFQDVTTAAGLGHLQKGHGVAFADLDGDGDQDLFLEVGGAFTGDFYPNALFENPGSGNHWITLRLQGVKANRSAIGARIRVDVATPAGDRSIHVVCGTGGSFGSSSLQQEIGLGDATAVKAIAIRWPGPDTRQTLTGAQLDRVYRIVEGRDGPDALEEVAVKRFRLGGN